MRPKPSSLGSAKGLTLVELLLVLVVGMLLLEMTLSIVLSNRRLYQVDQSRTALNQNLRAAMDMVGADVRQAGERLPQDFPAIEVIDGGQSDTLVLRRGLLDAVLPVCEPIRAGSRKQYITVAIVPNRWVKPPNAACTFDDGDGNRSDDRIDRWREFRCSQDGVAGCQGNGQEVLRAYVYNPSTRQGEWIIYDREGNSGVGTPIIPPITPPITPPIIPPIIYDREGNSGVRPPITPPIIPPFPRPRAIGKSWIHRADNGRWLYTYEVGDNPPRIYVLEEHRYRLKDGFLQLVINGDANNPRNVIDGVTAFSVRALMQDGTWREAIDSQSGWTDIALLEIGLTGRDPFSGRNLERTLTSRFVPRNILSY